MGLIVAEDNPATHSACLLLARIAIGLVDVTTAPTTTCTALAVTMFDKEMGLGTIISAKNRSTELYGVHYVSTFCP